jgi:RP/EB family microtubule-associated protein
MAKAMGMMSGCYFVGRGELLDWLNALLEVEYGKIEQTANGAAFCQILDAIHPGTVALGRVNYLACQGFEMTQNYRVLQDALRKNGITQYIDYVALAQAKYMAALEVLQWLHGYWQQTAPHGPYDAAARRRAAKCAGPPAAAAPRKTSGFPTSKPAATGNSAAVGKVGRHVVAKAAKT